jgi:hypothetical protein
LYKSKKDNLAILENSILSLKDKSQELDLFLTDNLNKIDLLKSSGKEVKDLLINQRDEMFNIAKNILSKYELLLNKDSISVGISPIQEMVELNNDKLNKEMISIGLSAIQEVIDLEVNNFISKIEDLMTDNSVSVFDEDQIRLLKNVFKSYFDRIDVWVNNYDNTLRSGFEMNVDTSNISSVYSEVTPILTSISGDGIVNVVENVVNSDTNIIESSVLDNDKILNDIQEVVQDIIGIN